MKHILNQFFDKIFIISIKRNAIRLAQIKLAMGEIEYEIFEGIDGKELYPNIEHVAYFPDDFFRDNQLDPEQCKRWNKGQLGCALSNHKVHLEIVSRGLGKVLILEDDALLLKESISGFSQAINELPLDWELFYLGYSKISKYSHSWLLRPLLRLKYKIKPAIVNGLNSAKAEFNFLPRNYTSKLEIPGVYYGTHAYGLSLIGAKKLLDYDTPLKFGFDILLMQMCYYKRLNSYALKDPLFIPNNSFSTSLIN